MTEAEIDLALAVNVKVPFVLVGELAPGMADRGKGAIVNVGTMVAEFGLAGMAIYGASKAALNLLTKAWRPSSDPGECASTPSTRGRRVLRGQRASARCKISSPRTRPPGGPPRLRR